MSSIYRNTRMRLLITGMTLLFAVMPVQDVRSVKAPLLRGAEAVPATTLRQPASAHEETGQVMIFGEVSVSLDAVGVKLSATMRGTPALHVLEGVDWKTGFLWTDEFFYQGWSILRWLYTVITASAGGFGGLDLAASCKIFPIAAAPILQRYG